VKFFRTIICEPCYLIENKIKLQQLQSNSIQDFNLDSNINITTTTTATTTSTTSTTDNNKTMAMLETPHNDPSIVKLKKRTRKTSPFRSPRASEFSESPCVVLRFRTPYKTTTQDNSFFEIVYSTPSMNEPSTEKPPIRLSRELNSLQIPTQERNSSPLYYYNERPKRTKKPVSQSVNSFNTSSQHHDSNSSQEDEEDFLDDSFHEKTGSGHDSEIERLKKTKPKVKGSFSFFIS